MGRLGSSGTVMVPRGMAIGGSRFSGLLSCRFGEGKHGAGALLYDCTIKIIQMSVRCQVFFLEKSAQSVLIYSDEDILR
jgi:hypothetical protein